MTEQNSCHLQQLEIVVGSYFDGENETFLYHFSGGTVNSPIEKSVPQLPAGEKCYSFFTLIDMYGIAVSTVNANFSKCKRR